MIHNVHERTVPGSPEQVWALLARLGSDDDPVWPKASGIAFRLPEGLRPGAPVLHGPMRYTVNEVEPGRRLSFNAPASRRSPLHRATHGFDLTPAGDGTRVRHSFTGGGLRLRLMWALFLGRKHDTVLEEILDRLTRLTARP
ncbi:SRPBCC domain-containing protein [Nocardiopsis sp. NRRL B-16309]|uniref:SRPBCC family protein n=1 Tax=Nocardiopsis sp. NRRL B-16309 TaxID=1519494 RepID=UPI0006AF0A09|nr:SRPBCC domain-containing protein [Nocardiopsis sp. NRRL B-16309]